MQLLPLWLRMQHRCVPEQSASLEQSSCVVHPQSMLAHEYPGGLPFVTQHTLPCCPPVPLQVRLGPQYVPAGGPPSMGGGTASIAASRAPPDPPEDEPLPEEEPPPEEEPVPEEEPLLDEEPAPDDEPLPDEEPLPEEEETTPEEEPLLDEELLPPPPSLDAGENAGPPHAGTTTMGLAIRSRQDTRIVYIVAPDLCWRC